MSTDTLKPCPWCGGRALAYDVRETHGICTVECTGCNAERSGDTPELAAEAWNCRASPSLDVDAVMALADDYTEAVSTVETSTHECWRSIDYRNKRIAEQHAAREALRSALMSNAAPEVDMSAELDVARLDWLENTPHSGIRIDYEGERVGFHITSWDDQSIGIGKTIRDAIDDARGALDDPLQGKETP